ncbi:MAG: hypothetical protein ACTSXU_06745 [Promethearchaeota archaeon]
MYEINRSQIFLFTAIGLLLFLNIQLVSISGADGTPAPKDVFKDKNGVGYDFTEHYWDIFVFDNSKWEVDDPEMGIDNQTTWVNNTWNAKWINEGNFEMGALAFMNKTGIDDAPNASAYSPAQMWWMNYYYEGHEMLIGNLLTAWYGFEDENANGICDGEESYTPFFYMTLTSEMNSSVFLGLSRSTSVKRSL